MIGSLRATPNFGRLGVRLRVMNPEVSREVRRISHNNNIRTVLSTLFVPYLQVRQN